MKTTATGPCTIANHGTGVCHASGTAGDATAAWEGLVRDHSGHIDHVADAVTRDIHDAQDRTQDVLLRVPRHRGSYQTGAPGAPLDQLLVDPVFDDDVLDALTAANPTVRVIVLSPALRGCGAERPSASSERTWHPRRRAPAPRGAATGGRRGHRHLAIDPTSPSTRATCWPQTWGGSGQSPPAFSQSAARRLTVPADWRCARRSDPVRERQRILPDKARTREMTAPPSRRPD
jgi:hypothetical protein